MTTILPNCNCDGLLDVKISIVLSIFGELQKMKCYCSFLLRILHDPCWQLEKHIWWDSLLLSHVVCVQIYLWNYNIEFKNMPALFFVDEYNTKEILRTIVLPISIYQWCNVRRNWNLNLNNASKNKHSSRCNII